MSGLKSALDDAQSGHPRLEMLAGEPGIGKTRIAEELALYATKQGAQVLWGSCYEGDGAPPYWPWVQPIRDYVACTDPDQLRAEMGSGAADIAQIVPQVLDKVPGEGQSFPIEPEQARFRLFDSVARFLNRASHNRSLMLVLDDLHWADQPSLLLLEYLARNLESSPILMLCPYRDIEISRQHPLNDTFTRLSRSPSFHRQTLTGLELEDVGAFVRSATGFAPSAELANAIHVHTEGNPFFMGEVLRLLNERGQTQLTTTFDPAQGLALPDTVRA
ncbi:MAG: AAA family ATPase, partial [Chloroflexi bacterium]|nr:AAA family ATPase [Chloroflexota bacterium]